MNKLVTKWGNTLSRRKRFIFIGVAVLVLLLLAGLFGWQRYEASNYQCRGGSESPIYKESVSMANNSFESKTDAALVKKIEQDKGYKKDVNCLYPLIKHYINAKNQSKAEELFNLFRTHYGDKAARKLYKQYTVKSYDDVKQQVDEYIKDGGNVDVLYF